MEEGERMTVTVWVSFDEDFTRAVYAWLLAVGVVEEHWCEASEVQT